MKKLIACLIFLWGLYACSSSDDINDSEPELSGTWKLIEMSGSVPNSETSGENMEWQETYRFQPDGSFIKSRTRDEETIEATGTYRWISETEERLLELEFNTENQIVCSCYQNNSETMRFQSETVFISSWFACDGPGLIYKKID
jgi:hypothetical protein